MVISIRLVEIFLIIFVLLEIIMLPVSIVLWNFMLVLISGVLEVISGIVWCCMFEFISVRLVSLCLRNGISVVVIDIIWRGEMFM